MKHFFLLLSLAVTGLAAQAADFKIAGKAINAFGVDLYRSQAHGDGNLLISPYSIQSALAMTYAGAEGDTRAEMQRVLHFPNDDAVIHGSFKSLALELAALKQRSLDRVKLSKKQGGPSTPIEFHVANRLFVQRGYSIRPAFLSLFKESYSASVKEMDFAKAPEPARVSINRWVASETNERVRDLIPSGALKTDNRLVLVDALYLRAPWDFQFSESDSHQERFLVGGRTAASVRTMSQRAPLGYAKRAGYQIVTQPYSGGELQFVIVLPDEPTGLAKIERALTPEVFQKCAHLESHDVMLHLPKFHLEPPTVPLDESLKKLGMKTAFDEPKGSANFDRMAPRRPDAYLAISAVLHKTFLSLDEKGTEAAAATAVSQEVIASAEPAVKPKPIDVRVDRPFLFAIQHVPSGACLFLGRVNDPR